MVSTMYPTEEMITAGIISVAGRDDLPELTRDEVATIYVAMEEARASGKTSESLTELLISIRGNQQEPTQ